MPPLAHTSVKRKSTRGATLRAAITPLRDRPRPGEHDGRRAFAQSTAASARSTARGKIRGRQPNVAAVLHELVSCPGEAETSACRRESVPPPKGATDRAAILRAGLQIPFWVDTHSRRADICSRS